jgi:hypothetical protein
VISVVLNLVVLLLSVSVSQIEMSEALNTAVSAANNDFTKDVYWVSIEPATLELRDLGSHFWDWL